jgi:hypothetical protein
MKFLSVALPAPKYSSAQENIKEKITNFLSMPRTHIYLDFFYVGTEVILPLINESEFLGWI